MSILNNSLLLGADAGGYQISRSLRFNSADSAYLSRTPASAGNRKTFTFSCWIKRSKAGDFRTIFSAATDTSNLFIIRFTDADLLEIRSATGGSTVFQLITTQVFRDFSAWYHIVVAVDTTNATGGDRVRLYINGSEITVFNTDTVPTQNADSWANNNVLHEICRQANNPSNYYQDGYLADVHLIDGQQLTPSSFAETNATTGQWVPKAYTGSYGTNGFRLDFSDNSAATATTLGKDRAGSNNWTPNNLSVTAGAGNDSLVDTPTSYGTDTGAGGQVRGNYCTWNSLRNDQAATLSNGNLELSTAGSTNRNGTYATIGVTTGKWYWEITAGSLSTDGYNIGIASSNKGLTDSLGSTAESYIYLSDASKRFNGVSSSYGATYTAGDVIGVALDLDAASLTFYKNGASQGTAFTGIPVRYWFPTVSDDSGGGTSGSSVIANFGQRSFAYTAPSGFKALCDTNLPAPTIARPSTVMDVKLYTGNNSTNAITGLGFSPDFIWIKARSSALNHILFDTVRTRAYGLYSNLTNAEPTASAANTDLASFDSAGFTLGGNYNFNVNDSGVSFAAWTWDAGSSTVTNTSGSISSQVRANASAGFSIVTYTGNGSTGATVGHGLGVSPGMVIVKRRNAAGDHWPVWHTSLGNNAGAYLDLTNASYSSSAHVQSVTSTTFIVGTDTDANASGGTYVAYCFAPVAGYSAFGSYTGNGSTDGPFVYTGFRPRWIMVKRSDAAYEWWVFDTARNTFNVVDKYISPNSSASEYTFNILDINANGFKLRDGSQGWNGSSGTIIWAAFAESPFQYARAR
jgi:hypothetical protein